MNSLAWMSRGGAGWRGRRWLEVDAFYFGAVLCGTDDAVAVEDVEAGGFDVLLIDVLGYMGLEDPLFKGAIMLTDAAIEVQR